MLCLVLQLPAQELGALHVVFMADDRYVDQLRAAHKCSIHNRMACANSKVCGLVFLVFFFNTLPFYLFFKKLLLLPCSVSE